MTAHTGGYLARPAPSGLADVVETVYNDIARQGPQIDKRATLRENLLRNARRGRVGLGGIEKPDLRYISYRESPKPRHKAVIILAMDVSGSMDAARKRMARLFFYWCVQFLRRRYEQTEIVFVGHTTEAWEISEGEFFGRVHLDYARERALRLAQQADGELDRLPPSPARDALRASITYVVDRRR